MKIINITNETDVQIYVKDLDGKDIAINIKPGEFVFCPTKEKTKSINLLLLKKNIDVLLELDKPNNLEFLVPYTEIVVVNNLEEELEEVENYPQIEDIENAVDAYINEEIVEEIKEKEKEKEDIIDSYINENPVLKEKKKYKYKKKKKKGRPKKRGPKKKKKPIGRPKGSKVKVGRPKKKNPVGRPPKPKKPKNPVGRPKGSKNKKKKVKQIKPK